MWTRKCNITDQKSHDVIGTMSDTNSNATNINNGLEQGCQTHCLVRDMKINEKSGIYNQSQTYNM